jgi:hypothetical protein
VTSKSAQLTSKALAKAKKALGKFTGKLASPILVPGPNAEWGPLGGLESLERRIARIAEHCQTRKTSHNVLEQFDPRRAGR